MLEIHGISVLVTHRTVSELGSSLDKHCGKYLWDGLDHLPRPGHFSAFVCHCVLSEWEIQEGSQPMDVLSSLEGSCLPPHSRASQARRSQPGLPSVEMDRKSWGMQPFSVVTVVVELESSPGTAVLGLG